MPVLTQKQTAELAGVTPQAVGRAIDRGKLVPTADRKIDTQHPTNASWLADRIAGDDAPDADAIRQETRDISAVADKTQLELEKLRQDIRTGAERERTLRLKREALAGTLVPREGMEQIFAEFGVALKTHILLLPRRIADHVTATARSEGPRAVEEYLADEISAAIDAAVKELTTHD